MVLLSEGFAWVPDLRSFNKLHEVGVSPYLRFTLLLSTLRMFELNGAVRGRLIGLKSLDRIVIIFGTKMEQPVTVPWLIGLVNYEIFVLNHVFFWMRPRMAVKCRFTK